MRILFCGKWPPIQGGVCRESFEFVLSCLNKGYSVTVVTNAARVEAGFRVALSANELASIFLPFGARFRLIDLGLEDFPSFIPYARPILSALTGAILTEVAQDPPDVIIGSYLEPFGMAALLAAPHHSVPTFIRHAGSDVGSLAAHPLLKQTYSHTLRGACGVLTHDNAENRTLLNALNVSDQQTLNMQHASEFPSFMSRQKLEIEHYAMKAVEHFPEPFLRSETMNLLEQINYEPWPEARPIIGIYGKAGQYKGTFELLKALQNLADYELQFRFVITLVGRRDTLSKVIETIASSTLRQRTRILPPLPLWKIPEYLANCDIVAFLENNFPIKSHTPRVPLEIISSGKTLLITREQCDRIGLTSVLQHNVNALIVEPPYDSHAVQTALSAVAKDTDLLKAVLSRGSLVRKLLGLKDTNRAVAESDMMLSIEKWFADKALNAPLLSSVES